MDNDERICFGDSWAETQLKTMKQFWLTLISQTVMDNDEIISMSSDETILVAPFQ
jgi:hypothetical protein